MLQISLTYPQNQFGFGMLQPAGVKDVKRLWKPSYPSRSLVPGLQGGWSSKPVARNKGIVNDPIVLTVYATGAPDLTLIDL